MTKKLSKNEYIGVAVALIVVAFMFFGIQNAFGIFSSKEKKIDPNKISTTLIKEGNVDGKVAEIGDYITLNYIGSFEDGTKFDSSYDRGMPYSFVLGSPNVILGLNQGLVGMKEGESRKLVVPPALAYGESGRGSIPPNATLIFEIELVKVEKTK